MDTASSTLIKISVAFEPDDYAWVLERARDLYGRRGLAMYIRRLVRNDRVQIEAGEEMARMERQRLEETAADEAKAARAAATNLGHNPE